MTESEKKEEPGSNHPSNPLLEKEGTESHPTSILPLPPKDGSASGGKERRRKSPTDFSAWQLVWELGYIIAIPIVVLALVGRWADKYFKTEPWLLLTGILISIVASSFLVYRRVKNILK